MTDSFLLDVSPGQPSDLDLDGAWTEALRRAPLVVRYVLSLLMVGIAVALCFALRKLMTPANMTLTVGAKARAGSTPAARSTRFERTT
jgi:hypothetical protein